MDRNGINNIIACYCKIFWTKYALLSPKYCNMSILLLIFNNKMIISGDSH